jgi:hypothetical protein
MHRGPRRGSRRWWRASVIGNSSLFRDLDGRPIDRRCHGRCPARSPTDIEAGCPIGAPTRNSTWGWIGRDSPGLHLGDPRGSARKQDGHPGTMPVGFPADRAIARSTAGSPTPLGSRRRATRHRSSMTKSGLPSRLRSVTTSDFASPATASPLSLGPTG